MRADQCGKRVFLLLLPLFSAPAAQDPRCWNGDVTWEKCCPTQYGPGGNLQCWDGPYTFDRCCGPPRPPPPQLPREGAPEPYPACARRDVVLRHAGLHGVFVDVAEHGFAGSCFQNNCSSTDKFEALDPAACARLCSQLEDCTHWSFGSQEGSSRCFLRGSDEGREWAPGWTSGTKACAPAALLDAMLALRTAECAGLVACDKGKSEECADVLAAMRTWRFAIRHLEKVVDSRVDDVTAKHVQQISTDSDALVQRMLGDYRPSDADFPRVVYNNRLIFNSLRGWLVEQTKAEVDTSDLSLPRPLRTGDLCTAESCYG